jgi:succinate dehydrogenase / fumarate reductase membrane anchor subunit
MSSSLRTPLGRVRGLGSSKEGVGHFITQRVSALALVVLVPWFLLSLIGAMSHGYDGAIDWIGHPLNAVMAILAVGTSLYHMRLGMQVVIEDYLTRAFLKNLSLILNTFICVLLFAAAAFSVLKIAG